MPKNLEIYNLLIDLRVWMKNGKPSGPEEKRLTAKIDNIIKEMVDTKAAEAGVSAAQRVFAQVLEKADPKKG